MQSFEPPASTATSNREQELLDRIAVLEESLSKSVYGTYILPRNLGEQCSLKSSSYENTVISQRIIIWGYPLLSLTNQYTLLYTKTRTCWNSMVYYSDFFRFDFFHYLLYW
ncbi:hypothetical protein GLOIN_2v1768440 [Rhizophagus irregularis DAOM 181602=DAOM 197198]|nr:hypothetical protein GLOIN_2v1768440 [Rhizophagus irregularis DAOM 181602=DAOM 197198]